MNKTATTSKTIWLNAVPLAITLLTAAMNDQFIASNPKLVAGLGAAIFTLNIVNRFFTNEPLKL